MPRCNNPAWSRVQQFSAGLARKRLARLSDGPFTWHTAAKPDSRYGLASNRRRPYGAEPIVAPIKLLRASGERAEAPEFVQYHDLITTPAEEIKAAA